MSKTFLTAYTFTPANKTIDFSACLDFDIRRLEAIFHNPTGRLLFAMGTPGLNQGGVATVNGVVNGLITLRPDLTGMAPTDPLTVIYDANGFIPQQTSQQVRAFLPEDNFGPGGSNSGIVKLLDTTLGLSYLRLANNGPSDAEIWFGGAPNVANVGQFPPQGQIVKAHDALVFDTRVPIGPVYATAVSATLFSILAGRL